jgi:hypothetical protein
MPHRLLANKVIIFVPISAEGEQAKTASYSSDIQGELNIDGNTEAPPVLKCCFQSE